MLLERLPHNMGYIANGYKDKTFKRHGENINQPDLAGSLILKKIHLTKIKI